MPPGLSKGERGARGGRILHLPPHSIHLTEPLLRLARSQMALGDSELEV